MIGWALVAAYEVYALSRRRETMSTCFRRLHRAARIALLVVAAKHLLTDAEAA